MPGMMRFKTLGDLKKQCPNLRVVGDTATPACKVAPVHLGPVMEKPTGSDLEELFAQQLSLTQLPKPIRQYLHLRGSKHTLDFAWPDLWIGVEVQGMVHRIKGSFKNDIKKRAHGLLQGWKVLEVGGAEIRDGTAMVWLHELFEMVRREDVDVR